MIELCNTALLKHKDLISKGYSCFKSMSYHEDGGLGIEVEQVAKDLLLSNAINLRGRFIKQHYFGILAKESLS